MRLKHLILLLLFVVWVAPASAQIIIEGKVVDELDGGPLVGATVYTADKQAGANTDAEGNFMFTYPGSGSVTVLATYILYDTMRVTVTGDTNITFNMRNRETETIVVKGSRISEKIKEDPQSVERMDLIAIKETPAANFYDGLGALKGVDITAASMGFKIINTRGFNSTSPVRTLQVIDGVDNQSPGLNFSLGNFAGANELDVLSVDIIQGASGAAYGPGAFNGVISMQTKDPFLYQGLDVMLKGGERELFETNVRYAKAFKDKNGKDRFAFKVNASYMRAYDWEATSYQPTDDSDFDENNPGGYDAINIYGDEYIRIGDFSDVGLRDNFPGLGQFYRTGYREVDLVDYNTRNVKLDGQAHLKINDDTRIIYSGMYSTGTTVYQGDNRYSLKDLEFYQHRLELEGSNWFIRTYMTGEDAGKSYDAVFAGLILQDMAKSDVVFGNAYRNWWTLEAIPALRDLPDFPDLNGNPRGAESAAALQSFYIRNQEFIHDLHNQARAHANGEILNPLSGEVLGEARLIPGTQAFQDSFNTVISRAAFNEGGARFVDFSKLYHVKAEYNFNKKDNDFMPDWLNVRVGGRFRYFTPDSRGTVFVDTLRNEGEQFISSLDSIQGPVATVRNGDTTFATPGFEELFNTSQDFRNTLSVDTIFERNSITLWETGFYALMETHFFRDRLNVNAAFRADRSQYFDWVYSPQFSVVYNHKRRHYFRANFSAAVRNPTLTDQFLFYNVGRARLLGNLNGYQNVVTMEDYFDWIDSPSPILNDLEAQAIDIDPIVPEKVQTVEVGYKGNLVDKLFVDASYYFSWYQDFIGFNLITPIPADETNPLPEPLRVSANANTDVTTQGFSIAANYYIGDFYAINGNYTWTVLNQADNDDPIIPAYNTPEHKFNIGVSGRDMKYDIGSLKLDGLGFNVNFRWVEGFLFEGSPQFTGRIDTYYTVDAQVNYNVKKWDTIFKIGASNLLDQRYIQAYGGPEIGRMAYASVTFHID